ncbi:hypothetical protein K431DRAFT_281375 [Polychaeton citri CBS 116435]|uniref:Acyltransferase 3 domain-containing protein n=1 Tax=Polychaeton citri CBS 116435 TaxID=1314669 RepID=A0A9P4QFX7_9PEZI|nr:hypothetical protein K431DRAFT_281375 [Polychaeton citri CBS 116435]
MKSFRDRGQPDSRESWIDGLRGFAACVVVLFHLTNVEVQVLYRSYWDEPREQNRQWVQLPPFRLFTSGIAMSRLFFAISGYCLSLGVNGASDDRQAIDFYHRLTSSCLRRPFRLYIPVVIWTAFEHTMWYANLYDWDLLGSKCPDAQPWGAVVPHFQCWARFILDLLNCVWFQWNMTLNVSLWALPYELLGSFTASILLLSLASARSNVKIGAIGIVALYLLYYGSNEAGALLGGLGVAELKSLRRQQQTTSIAKGSKRQEGNMKEVGNDTGAVGFFLIALYIMTLPFNDNWLTSDWWFQPYAQVPLWKSPPLYAVSWYAMGSVMLIAAIQELEAVKSVLNASPLQFLGRISFSIYLVHMTVLHILRQRILDMLCLMLRGQDYWQSKHYGISDQEFTVVWVLTSAILGVAILLVATCFASWVERPSKRWTYQIQKWIEGTQKTSSKDL